MISVLKSSKLSQSKLTAVYSPNKTGNWSVYIKELNGCCSWGKDLPHAQKMMRETLRLWLDEEGQYTIEDIELSEEFAH